MSDDAPVRTQYVYYNGLISDVSEEREEDRLIGLRATITRTIKGETISRSLYLAADDIARLGHMIAPGKAALCGFLEGETYRVIGPDLRRQTLLKAETQAYRPRRANRTEARIARDRHFAKRYYAKLKAQSRAKA